VADACDAPETCTGTSSICPVDAVQPAGVVCRPATDVCDAAETCTGTGSACPGDVLQAAGTVCRAAAGACDVAESCTGASPACPADTKSTALCRVAAGACDVEEACDGFSNDCPQDALAPSTTECRPTAGECDLAELCTGVPPSCPADTGQPDDDGDGICDVADGCPSEPGPSQADADGDGVGDACDPCSNLVPVFTTRPLLKIRRLGMQGGNTLVFHGSMVLPESPTIDPASKGVRLVLEDAAGSRMLDALVPGGLGWKRTGTGWLYTNRGDVHGITRISIIAHPASPGRIGFLVTGKHGSYATASPHLPVKGTLVIDSPIAATGQCGEATFPGPPGPRCKVKGSGRSLVCE
jgi:hypothetical protein